MGWYDWLKLINCICWVIIFDNKVVGLFGSDYYLWNFIWEIIYYLEFFLFYFVFIVDLGFLVSFF